MVLDQEILSMANFKIVLTLVCVCHQASAARKRCVKNPKTSLAAESSVAVSVHSKADSPKERLSCISCECHQTAGRRRCSASPEHEGQEGKENERGLDSCRLNGASDKQEPEDMDCEETLFPDDDSNQILPVEQFFGNLDVVQVRCRVWYRTTDLYLYWTNATTFLCILQDFPQRPSATSGRVQRESRRRYYYAREDSDEEEVGPGSIRSDDRGGTWWGATHLMTVVDSKLCLSALKKQKTD